jgi:hypothetical protein
MRLNPALKHRLNSATLLAWTVLGGVFVITSLVTASGVLPIRISLLLTSGFASGLIGAMPAVLFGRNRRRFVPLAILAALVTVIAPSLIFRCFQQGGLEYAKQYGSRWARAVTLSRNANRGEWPADLSSVAPELAPRLNLPEPYIAECQASVCERIAGYSLHYEIDDAKPHLMVGRRETAFEWNWNAGKWVELELQHQ